MHLSHFNFNWLSISAAFKFDRNTKHYYKNGLERVCFVSFVSKWANDSNLLETVALCVILVVTFICQFLLCEPCERMTMKFGMFVDELEQCDWYLLPIEMQRMYAIFLSDTQKPIKMRGYGGIKCERETSKNVQFINFYEVIHTHIPFNFDFSICRFTTKRFLTL